MWTDDPATDILNLARSPTIGWLLLGFHRPVFGGDFRGGLVKEIVTRARAASDLRLHVGIVIHRHAGPIDKVVAIVDPSPHGRAALELAARLAAHRQCSLHALLVPAHGAEPEPELQDLVRETARTAGKWLHTDIVDRRAPETLEGKTRAPVVVMGTDLVDVLGLPLFAAASPAGVAGVRSATVPDGCVVVVEGARRPGE